MKRIGIIFWCVVLVFLSSCGNSKEEKINKIKEQVMQVHDSIMPQMGTIMELKSKIRQNLKDSVYKDKQLQDSAKAAIKKLKKADKAMKDWMHEYDISKLDNMDWKEAKNYLDSQKKNIIKVRKKFNKSIKNAKDVLNNDKKEK